MSRCFTSRDTKCVVPEMSKGCYFDIGGSIRGSGCVCSIVVRAGVRSGWANQSIQRPDQNGHARMFVSACTLLVAICLLNWLVTSLR